MLQLFFVAAVRATACEKRAGVLRDEGRGNSQPHRIEWNSSSTEFEIWILILERRHLLQRRRAAVPRVSKESNHSAGCVEGAAARDNAALLVICSAAAGRERIYGVGCTQIRGKQR
jgi:hypothetical protein